MTEIEDFLKESEEQVSPDIIVQALDIALKATLARWWGTQKQHIGSWDPGRRMLTTQFGYSSKYIQDRYTGEASPWMYIDKCVTTRHHYQIPDDESVHQFVHTLDTILMNWYIQQEMRHATSTKVTPV